ncbi:MAG: phosphodiester glycosidase family protein [Cytophagaceae bacterium]|nr:phosphodiester glycosidase family protein [Cytophagaceae bacterium]
MFWKNENHEPFRSIQNLKLHLEKQHEKLEFAMNGGMFKPDYTPVGLFIQQGKILAPLDTGKGYGNFYLKPNGVFYLHQYKGASIVPTDQFKYDSSITIATQSGPMLITNGKIHPAFNPTSANKVIRNGAGILPDQRIVFAISKQPINFYHFASFFISMGCKEALYLDGYVSRMYLPEKNWKQTDSNVGILIGISRKQ